MIVYYPQETPRNIDEVVRAVKVLQVAGKEGAVPAGWPENELVGDHIVVAPATDANTARDRAGQYECYDWWFCHKPLEK